MSPSSTDGQTARWSVRLLILIAISLLVLVHHFFRVHTQDLSMWKGGGMGMFSTQDAPGTRVAAVRLVTAQGEYTLNAAAIGKPLINYRALPTPAHLRRLCLAVAHQQWAASGNTRAVTLADGSVRTERLAEPAVHGSQQTGVLQVEEVRVNAWKVRVDASTGDIQRVLLGEAHWVVGAQGGQCDISR